MRMFSATRLPSGEHAAHGTSMRSPWRTIIAAASAFPRTRTTSTSHDARPAPASVNRRTAADTPACPTRASSARTPGRNPASSSAATPVDRRLLALGTLDLRAQLGAQLLRQRGFVGGQVEHHRNLVEPLGEWQADAAARRAAVRRCFARGARAQAHRRGAARARPQPADRRQDAAIGEKRNRTQEAAKQQARLFDQRQHARERPGRCRSRDR